MPDSNLAHDYVADIPWEEYPAFAFSNDTKAYLAALKDAVDVLPTRDLKVSFHDDVWDFNPYFDGVNNKTYKVLFGGFPQPLKTYCKFFFLHRVMNRKKISSVNVRVASFLALYKGITESGPHDSLVLITTDDIVSWVKNRDLSFSTQHNYYVAAQQVYEFLEGNYGLELPVDTKKLQEMAVAAKKAARQKQDDTKIPDIPIDYFNAIVREAVAAMRDPTTFYNTRATACMIVIISQLGLRCGDLMALRTGDLHTKRLAKSGREAHYIHYKARKPSKPNDADLEFDIFSSALCTEAFVTMREIRERCPLSQGNDFLYVLDPTQGSNDTLPIPNYRFNNEFKRFLLAYLPAESDQDWEGIERRKLYLSNDVFEMVATPDTRQFRVRVCTALYEHNVPLQYIMRYMGHLTEYMLGYYVRPKDTFQENVAYTEHFIQEIVTEDLTLLGGRFGPEIVSNIRKFIEDGKFNVETDIHSIVEALEDRVVVRAKEGGLCCVRTSTIPCAKDARSNELLCAYNICPNLFHTYTILDITYLDFITLQETYDSLCEQGLDRAAEKELNKLKRFCRDRLIKELDELDRELQRRGAKYILERHPTLVDIVDNKDEIREEAEAWLRR